VTTGGEPTEATTADNTWSDGGNVNTASATWAIPGQTKPTATTSTCSGSAFTAIAYGTPATSGIDPGATDGDTWTIDEKKLLRNTQVYLGL
jgi:hypothetical protein